MYLKKVNCARNSNFVLTHRMEMQHNNVTLRLRTKRINCVRTQSLSVAFKNAAGEDVETPFMALDLFSERPYVSNHALFRQVVLDWIKYLGSAIPVQAELALRSIVNQDVYIKTIADKLRNAIAATTHHCETTRGVSIASHRSSLVFPTTGGFHVRIDVKMRRKKYTTYFSVVHPDYTTRNENGVEVATIFTATRYGIVLGAKGLYSLINGWCKDSTLPNVSMLKAAAPELLAMINDDRKKTVDDFFNIINSQAATHVSVP